MKRFAALGLLCALVCAAVPAGATEPTPAPQDQLVFTFAGDCTLGAENYKLYYPQSLLSVVDEKGMDWPFSATQSLFANDDLSLVNLEGTFTESRKAAVKSFTFRAPARYADILVQGSIEAVNLANNHTMDFHEKGYVDTKAALDARNIAYSAAYEPAVVQIRGYRIALMGLSYPLRKTHMTALCKEIGEIRTRENIDLIIVSFHWGQEMEYKQQREQIKAAHQVIDAGADMVVGTHPHVLQGMEMYQGKPIFYSLGNFSFGGNLQPKDIDTVIMQTTYDLTPEGPRLARLEAFPCRLSDQPAGQPQNYRPVFVQGEDAARVLEKLSFGADGLPEEFFVTGRWDLRP